MSITTIAIGDRAMDSRGNPGTISFIGKTQFDSGFWVGIELDEPVGKNNGTIEGVTYFKCGNKRGVFVRKPALLRRLNSPLGKRVLKATHLGNKKFSPKKPFRGSTTSPSSSPKKGSPKSKTSASSSSMSSTNVKAKKRRKKVSTPRTNKVDPKLLEQRLTELKQHKTKAKKELALVKEKLLQVQSEHKNVQNIEKQNTNEQIKILKEQLKNEKHKREEMQKKRDKYALEELKSRKHLQSAKKKILTSELNLENKSEQLYILIDEILDSGPQNENWKKLKLLYSIVAIRGIKDLQSEMEKKISKVKEIIEKTEKSLN
ncbi:dynactin 1-related microtubule-binding [Anaeramoeba flamelloides]|uniref:Dynactin 1-related microtubule-binding n=1 Tax=Anaeramoeba flamelloides TaxID=1746091 RepID=A0ABQ8Y8D3_9EUKA|nr:dynactin 1-related microtubule-binding [Anaeramoeba flamelloides]